MEPISVTASTTSRDIPVAGFDLLGTIINIIGGNETTASFFSANGFIDFLNTIWLIYIVLAFSFSIILLGLYAYASTKRWQYFALGDKEIRDEEIAYDEKYRGIKKSSRLSDVLQHIDSINPNDWKLAIIEADIILDEVLKERGYAGSSLGERLRGISSGQLNSLNDAWEAHKIRNRIAHDGADFVLTKRMAEDTINQYRRVFSEFDIV